MIKNEACKVIVNKPFITAQIKFICLSVVSKDCHARQLVWAWLALLRAPVIHRSKRTGVCVCVCVDGHRGGGVKLHCLLVFYLETDSELEVEAVLTEIISVVDFQAHYYKLTVCI